MDTNIENVIKVHLNCENVLKFEEVESVLYSLQKNNNTSKKLVYILFSH